MPFGRVAYGQLSSESSSVRLEELIENCIRNNDKYSTNKVASKILGNKEAKKGVEWMPWHQEPMKDVITCDKLCGAGHKL